VTQHRASCSSSSLATPPPSSDSSDSSSLAPLVEQEGEAYLEKSGVVRRHTVASGHSDHRLLSASGRMEGGGAGGASEEEGGGGGASEEEDGGGGARFLVGGEPMGPRTFSRQLDMEESPRVGAICLPHS